MVKRQITSIIIHPTVTHDGLLVGYVQNNELCIEELKNENLFHEAKYIFIADYKTYKFLWHMRSAIMWKFYEKILCLETIAKLTKEEFVYNDVYIGASPQLKENREFIHKLQFEALKERCNVLFAKYKEYRMNDYSIFPIENIVAMIGRELSTYGLTIDKPKLVHYMQLLKNDTIQPHRSEKILTRLETIVSKISDDGVYHPYYDTVHYSGRISSDFHNLPKKDYIVSGQAINFQELFIVPKGYQYVVFADLSQIQLRIVAEYCNRLVNGKSELAKVFDEEKDIFLEISPNDRQRGKTVAYAILYGGGVNRIADLLDVDIREAKELYEGFMTRFPEVKALIEFLNEEASKKGEIVTLHGRVLKTVPRYSILNELVMATEGEITKTILCRMRSLVNQVVSNDPEYNRLISTVHDEFIFTTKKENIEHVASWIYEFVRNMNLPEMGVPIKIKVEYTKTNFKEREVVEDVKQKRSKGDQTGFAFY